MRIGSSCAAVLVRLPIGPIPKTVGVRREKGASWQCGTEEARARYLSVHSFVCRRCVSSPALTQTPTTAKNAKNFFAKEEGERATASAYKSDSRSWRQFVCESFILVLFSGSARVSRVGFASRRNGSFRKTCTADLVDARAVRDGGTRRQHGEACANPKPNRCVLVSPHRAMGRGSRLLTGEAEASSRRSATLLISFDNRAA